MSECLQGFNAGSTTEEALGPLVLIDTAGCGMEEAADEDSGSKRNEVRVTRRMRMSKLSTMLLLHVSRPDNRMARHAANIRLISLKEENVSLALILDWHACQGEAAVALAHAQRLLSAGVRPERIGIITPYNAQVHSLAHLDSGKLALA